MRRWIPFLALAPFLAVAARPLWSSDLLFSYDGPLHLMRVFALDLTLRQGVVYPRWLLDLAYGYGYPIFDYYPPFSAYAAESVHLLGLDLLSALKVTFTIIIAAALAGSYVLGVELFAGESYSWAIGLLTAVAYVFFPYFMVGIYTRGALAEGFAVALLPWLVWSLRRLLERQKIAFLLLTGLLLGILLVAHSLTALLTVPFFVAYVVFESLRLPPSTRIKAVATAGASALLGIGLTAFYWLPFIVELRLVKMGSGLDILSDVFETNFLKLSALVQPYMFYQYGGPPVPLGLAAMTIAAIVLVGAIWARSRLRACGTIFFFGAVAIIGAMAITEPARELWLAFPASSMIQSVWRVELLINLGVAVVIGSMPLVFSALIEQVATGLRRIAVLQNCRGSPRWLPRATAQGRPYTTSEGRATWVAPLAAAALTALALVWTTMANLSPHEILAPSHLFDLAHLARFEVSGASPGTTTFGEYMPVTMRATDLVNYDASKTVALEAPSPQIHLVEHSGTEWLLSVSSDRSVSIPLRAFYFPDWHATVDGAPAKVHASTPMGLLTVDVPGGNHEVRIFQADTSIRQVAFVFSGITGLIALGLAAYSLRRGEPDLWVPLVLIILLLGVIMLPALATETGAPVALDSSQTAISPSFDLIGLTLVDARLEGGAWRLRNPTDQLHIRPYWQVKGSGLADSPVTWRLTDTAGRTLAQRAQLPRYGTARQSSWVIDEIVQDEYDLPLNAAIPSGNYNLQISPAADEPFVTVGALHLEAGSVLAAPPQPQPIHPVDAVLGSEIRLLGYDASSTARAGQSFPLTLFWQAERDVLQDYTASVQLLDPNGKLAVQHDSITGEGLNPSSLWIPGQAVAERRQLELPSDLKPGTYTLIALMYSLRDLKRLPVVMEAGASPDNAVTLGQVQLSGNAPLDSFGVRSLFASIP